MKKNILHRALSASAIVAGTDEYWEWDGVEVPPNNTYWYKTVDDVMLDDVSVNSLGSGNVTSHTYENGKGVIVISGNWLSIDSHVFSGKTNIKTIIMPENVNEVDSYAFQNCTNLEDVRIGKASIGSYSFSGCQNMKRFVVSANNTSHDSRDNCNGLIRKSSNGLVFGWGCTTKIPEGVVQTHGEAYSGITTIKSVEFPSTFSKLGGSTFKGCSNLKTLRFNRAIAPTIDNNTVFYGVGSGGILYCPTGSTGYSDIKPSGWSIVYF